MFPNKNLNIKLMINIYRKMNFQIFEGIALSQGLILRLIQKSIFKTANQTLKVSKVLIEQKHSEKILINFSKSIFLIDRINDWVAFFRLPKTEDHFTGHRFEIEPNGFLHVIGKCLVRALRVVSDLTGNRKCPKKNYTLTLKTIGCERKCQFFHFLQR